MSGKIPLPHSLDHHRGTSSAGNDSPPNFFIFIHESREGVC